VQCALKFRRNANKLTLLRASAWKWSAMSIEGVIAANRFGLGARPGEIEAASRAPKDWLMAQLDEPAGQPTPLGEQKLMSGGELVVDALEYQRQQKIMRQARANDPEADPVKSFFKNRVKLFNDEMAARFAHGFATDRPFAERLVWFWSNHFGVSAMNPRATTFVGAFEREAIRPHITGSFEEMTQAAVRHPAMLLYLDNAQSIGPDSPAGARSGKGLNENLGRELMELFTLGVDGGYTQADVIAMAKLLTGWSLDRNGGGDNGFRFYPARHEPGEFTLRGKTYPAGYNGTVAAVSDLARDPATARHIAGKFAQAFISDAPSQESVARLEQTFRRTKGSLKALAQTAVNDPHAWTPQPGKMRSPVEYVTAAYRLLGLPKAGTAPDAAERQVRGAMGAARLMGEFPLSAPSPKGWPLDSASWSGPDAILNRVEWARQVGQRIPPTANVAGLAEQGLGPLLGAATKTAMMQASSKGEAVALLLASPEFQRR
jgi:uncharacterized protein (DUF1800 family)